MRKWGQEKVSKFLVIIYKERESGVWWTFMFIISKFPSPNARAKWLFFYLARIVFAAKMRNFSVLIAIRGIKMFKLLKSCLWKTFQWWCGVALKKKKLMTGMDTWMRKIFLSSLRMRQKVPIKILKSPLFVCVRKLSERWWRCCEIRSNRRDNFNHKMNGTWHFFL